jgi:anti-sigma28 factor (negative regulator of flagellin synthesis)
VEIRPQPSDARAVWSRHAKRDSAVGASAPTGVASESAPPESHDPPGPGGRVQRMAELRRMIRDGAYHVDARGIAAAILADSPARPGVEG